MELIMYHIAALWLWTMVLSFGLLGLAILVYKHISAKNAKEVLR